MTEATASAATAFMRKPRVIELPGKGDDGETLHVSIRRVSLREILPHLQGIPGAAAAKPDDAVESAKHAMDVTTGPMREIARLGLVAPEFSFDAREEGKAFWGDLEMDNQVFIATEILALSGLGGSADSLSTFPDGKRGGRVRRGRGRSARANGVAAADAGDGAAA